MVICKLNKTILTLKSKNEQNLININNLTNSLFVEYEFNKIKINKDQILLKSLKEYKFSDIVFENKIVLYFSNGLCSHCNKNIIDEFSGNLDKIGRENILVLVPELDIDDFEILNEESKLELSQVYSIRDTTLDGFPKDASNKPLLFMIDDSFKVINVFKPTNSNIKLFSEYLVWIRKEIEEVKL